MSNIFKTFSLKNIRKVLFSVLLPLVLCEVSTFIVRSKLGVYDVLVLPHIAPPSRMFGITGTILCVLMGIASYYIITSTALPLKRKKITLTLYYTLLALNFFWGIVFYSWQLYAFTFIWAVILFVLTITVTIKFYDISRTAGWLMIPVLAWMCFAVYLDYMIWMLN